MKEVLVLAITRMGDLIQQTPLLAALRARWPDARITALVEEKFRDVCGGVPFIDRVVAWDKTGLVRAASDPSRSLVERMRGVEAAVREIGPGPFDLIVNLIHSQFGALVVRLVPHEEVWGMTMDDEGYRAIRSPWLRYFFTAVSHRRLNTFNLVDMYRMNVPGTKGPGRLLFNLSEEARAWARAFLNQETVQSSESGVRSIQRYSRRPQRGAGAAKPLVAIQPGASKEERRWPPELFGELAGRLADAGCRILLLGVEEERASAEIVKKTAGVEMIDAVGKTSIDRLGALLERVALLVTNDTGTMHMASAVGTRVLVLSMCHSNPFETGPYDEGHWAVSPSLACYPCEFSTNCADRVCTRMLPVEAVFEAASAMLAGVGAVNDGPAWASADLWRTTFDADGLLRFRPLFKRALTAERLAQLVYAKTWASFLFENGGTDAARDLAGELREDYLASGELAGMCKALSRPFERLAEAAGSGAATASELARLAGEDGQAGGRLEKIESLGMALKDLDGKIEELAETERVAAPLVRYFMFLKEAISGADVAGLARQTAGAYADLARLAGLFPKLLDRGGLRDSDGGAAGLGTGRATIPAALG